MLCCTAADTDTTQSSSLSQVAAPPHSPHTPPLPPSPTSSSHLRRLSSSSPASVVPAAFSSSLPQSQSFHASPETPRYRAFFFFAIPQEEDHTSKLQSHV